MAQITVPTRLEVFAAYDMENESAVVGLRVFSEDGYERTFMFPADNARQLAKSLLERADLSDVEGAKITKNNKVKH